LSAWDVRLSVKVAITGANTKENEEQPGGIFDEQTTRHF